MSRADMDRLLAEAIGPERRAFRIAGLLAAAATISAVLLLGLSGWFITGAALAGLAGVLAAQGFNYLVPSALIRLLAIIRTTARYGERLCGCWRSPRFARACSIASCPSATCGRSRRAMP